mgnify:CR=1 FL=1
MDIDKIEYRITNDKYTIEYCSSCEQEVKLKNEFKIQKCPKCGAYIIPCNLCPIDNECTSKCPLDILCRIFEREKKMKI